MDSRRTLTWREREKKTCSKESALLQTLGSVYFQRFLNDLDGKKKKKIFFFSLSSFLVKFSLCVSLVQLLPECAVYTQSGRANKRLVSAVRRASGTKVVGHSAVFFSSSSYSRSLSLQFSTCIFFFAKKRKESARQIYLYTPGDGFCREAPSPGR